MTPAPVLRRVVIAVEDVDRAREPLEIAANLAAGLGVDLRVVLVERQDLMDLADLPIAREVALTGGRAGPLDRRRLARAMQAQNLRLQATLADLAGRQRISWTMDVRRCRIAETASAEAEPGDVVTLTGAIDHLPKAAAVLAYGRRRRKLGRGPVMVLTDADRPNVGALQLAAGLARRIERAVIVLAKTAGELTAGEREAMTAALPGDMAPMIRALPREAVAGHIAEAVSARQGALLIAAEADLPEDPAELTRLADDTPGPLLILRTESEG